MTPVLARVLDGQSLTREEMSGVMDRLLAGEGSPAQVGALLGALRVRGETVEELTGAALSVRRAARRVDTAIPGLVDTCGTGGDGRGTFNISTAAAVVASAGGVVVAKHGNRSVSSRCGSADVLEALGVTLDAEPAALARTLELAHLAFLFAPAHHPAFRHVGPVRKELGVRTMFNLLGPLANPAGARRQVLGVFDARLAPRLADVLRELEAEHALVVHGEGLDEVSVCGPTVVEEVKGTRRSAFTVTPEELGLSRHPIEALAGGDVAANARILLDVLDGQRGAPRDATLANAAAALVVGGAVDSLPAGVALATRLVDSGAARAHFDRFLRIQRGDVSTLDRIVAVTFSPAAPARSAGEVRPAVPSPGTRSLFAALSPRGGPDRVIAEVKRRSPSAGRIADIPDAGAHAARYVEEHRAAAISVLTNGPHFGGSLDDLRAVRRSVPVPVLRKEFIVDPRQLDEAVEAGADAVLLIAAVLGRGLDRMLAAATGAGLEALVEIHDRAELDLALEAGATIIGINNRDLRTFAVDLGVTEALAPLLPDTVRIVAESGIRSREDQARLRAAGVSNFLVGEFLVRGGSLTP